MGFNLLWFPLDAGVSEGTVVNGETGRHSFDPFRVQARSILAISQNGGNPLLLELNICGTSTRTRPNSSNGQVVKGTVNPDGPFSRGAQKGAAYVFRRSDSTGLWYEDTKLFLDDGVGTDRYGWQVRVVKGLSWTSFLVDACRITQNVYDYGRIESRTVCKFHGTPCEFIESSHPPR